MWAVHHVGVGDRAQCISFPQFVYWSCVNYRGRLHEVFLSAKVYLRFVKFFCACYCNIF